MTQPIKPINYAARVLIPAAGSINSGLTYCRPATALSIFGPPAVPLPRECGRATSKKLLAVLVTEDVGAFRVTGIRPAIDSLKRIFARVKAEKPDLYAAVGTAGMLCVRCVRGYPGTPSNHAFGAAIDLKMHGELVPLAADWAQLGTLQLYYYFHQEGWFWGASWERPDAMHFEVSDERLREWHAAGLI